MEEFVKEMDSFLEANPEILALFDRDLQTWNEFVMRSISQSPDAYVSSTSKAGGPTENFMYEYFMAQSQMMPKDDIDAFYHGHVECVKTCPLGFYTDSWGSSWNGAKCSLCDDFCDVCEEGVGCLQCVEGAYWVADEERCVAACTSDYSSGERGLFLTKDDQCISCPEGCSSCSISGFKGQLECHTCAPYFRFD